MPTYTDPTIIQLGDKPRIQISAWLFLCVGIVAVLGCGWLWYRTYAADQHSTELTSTISTQNTELTKLAPVANALTTIGTQARSLQTLFDNQKRWESVLGTLEKHLYSNMLVTDLQLDSNGQLVFSGVTPSFTDYAKLYTSLTDSTGAAYFSLVRPVSVTKVEDVESNSSEVQFSFSLTLQPQVLNSDAVLKLTDLMTATK